MEDRTDLFTLEKLQEPGPRFEIREEYVVHVCVVLCIFGNDRPSDFAGILYMSQTCMVLFPETEPA